MPPCTHKCSWTRMYLHRHNVHIYTRWVWLLLNHTSIMWLSLFLLLVLPFLVFDLDTLLGTVVSYLGRILLISTVGISPPKRAVIQPFTKVLSMSQFALRSFQYTPRTLGCCIPDWEYPSDLERRGLGSRHLPLKTGTLTQSSLLLGWGKSIKPVSALS